MERNRKKPDLRVIEKSCSFSLKNKVCDKQGLFLELWKFQIETVSQLNRTYEAS